MSVFSRVSTSRNKSSFVGGYLRHGERFAAWFTGQSWWTHSRTMSGDRTRGKEKESMSEGGRETGGKTEKRQRARKRKRDRGREGTFFLVAEEENEGPSCVQGREGRGECRAVLIEV